jgi:hypothetical protein
MTDNRESREAIAQLADLFGATCEFQPGGKHCRVILIWRERRASMFIGSTPGDWRATRNNISIARRLLRGLAEMQPGESAHWPRFMLPREGAR